MTSWHLHPAARTRGFSYKTIVQYLHFVWMQQQPLLRIITILIERPRCHSQLPYPRRLHIKRVKKWSPRTRLQLHPWLRSLLLTNRPTDIVVAAAPVSQAAVANCTLALVLILPQPLNTMWATARMIHRWPRYRYQQLSPHLNLLLVGHTIHVVVNSSGTMECRKLELTDWIDLSAVRLANQLRFLFATCSDTM
jgi:hypothetical protein